MIALIPEDDWKNAVQIIGWLYQFYNIEPKAAVFAKNGKISKEEIPAATQLFTPDWIVRYMVENSLGRLWLDHNAGSVVDEYDERPGDVNELLLHNWRYDVFEAEQESTVQSKLKESRKEYSKLTPEQIKCIDPCAGSGHILAYMFDVLMQIYESYGYTTRDAVRSIIENNIFGLDIDDRAAQLAYFAVMMKARQYDRRFLTRKNVEGAPDVPKPHVHAFRESNGIDGYAINCFHNGDDVLKKSINKVLSQMRDAKEYGSILKIETVDYDALYTRFDEIADEYSLSRDTILSELLPLVNVAQIMAQRYSVVITNPPYMGGTGMSPKLSTYVKKHYPDSKSDLYSVFIEKCSQMTEVGGYQAMITQQGWMFLSSFEALRSKILNQRIINMAHLGARAFEEIGGEVVQTTSFVIQNTECAGFVSSYLRLTDANSQDEKECAFLEGNLRFDSAQDRFKLILGTPIAYWVELLKMEEH